MKNVGIIILIIVTGCAARNQSAGVKLIDRRSGDITLRSGDKLKQINFIGADYPADLRQAGVEGEVKIQFTVLPNGLVTDLTITKSAHPKLDEYALAAVARWAFAPYDSQRNGIPRLEVPIKFTLQD